MHYLWWMHIVEVEFVLFHLHRRVHHRGEVPGGDQAPLQAHRDISTITDIWSTRYTGCHISLGPLFLVVFSGSRAHTKELFIAIG